MSSAERWRQALYWGSCWDGAETLELRPRQPSSRGLFYAGLCKYFMNIIKAHAHSIHHRTEIEASEVCGCFHCLEIYRPGAIAEWVDESNDTALCPRCGIDAVIGSASGASIDAEFLGQMHRYWFSGDPD